jgi:hypothetical protein
MTAQKTQTVQQRHDITRELEDAVQRLPPPEQSTSFAPYLPLFFSLKGKPLTLHRHFTLDPMYQRRLPWRTVYKCARQVGKSLNVSASNLASSAVRPYFQTLFVTPLFEMARRLSSNYVRPLILESPIRNLLINSRCEKSVLQKTLSNQAMLHFSFAFLDCERCRGLSVDRCNFDEVQGFDPAFLPIIAETMSASVEFGISCYTGTPMTLDNTLELLWQESSMAEWIIPCDCGHYNIPALGYDIEKMIGPVKNIGLYGTGLVCGKCGKPIDAARGEWVPRFPERAPVFSGVHIPQIILPLHYEDERKWSELVYKRDHILRATYLNECLGEACDQGVRLVSLSDLRRASQLDWTLDQAATTNFRNKYEMIAMGVDWGGGGKSQESTTAIAVVGIRPDGKLDTLYLERLDANATDEEELTRIAALYRHYRCDWFAHDFAGAGRVKDTQVRQGIIAGERIMPMQYVATGARNLVVHHPPTADSFRYYYSFDKTWSLSLLLQLIKGEQLRFPKNDEKLDKLLADFLALTEEKRERTFVGDVYLIKRAGNTPDDVAHAVNFAAGALFHVTGKFPDITNAFRSALSRIRGGVERLNRLGLSDWEAGDDEIDYDA